MIFYTLLGKLLLTKFIKMKKLLLLSLIGLFISCGNQNCETPSNVLLMEQDNLLH